MELFFRSFKEKGADTMALNNDIAHRQALKRAMRLAEMRVEDTEDMNACVNDLVKVAGLDEDSARIVASAYRESMLDEVLNNEGFDRSDFEPEMDKSTANFADDKSAEPEMANDELESPEMNKDSEDAEGMDDMSEENDDNVATLEVEVPADKVDDFQQALEKAMTEVFGPSAVAEEQDEEVETSDDLNSEPVVMDEMPATANRKVKNMERNSARAQREAILASLAGNTRTASDFEYAADAQYSNEGQYDKMTMQSSEGNSLREQNPTFAKQDVPTLNPELLGLKNELKGVKKEGSPEDSSMYEANFDLFSGTPSEGILPEFDNFDVPTQTDMTSRSNIVLAQVENQEDAEEFLFQALTSEGVSEDQISNMTFAEGIALYKEITANKVNALTKVAVDVEVFGTENLKASSNEIAAEKEEEAMKAEEEETEAAWKQFAKKEAEAFRARLKTAYGVSTKLCLAGLISPEEVEANVDLWLNDGLTVKAMLASGAQMLRMSQSAEQRVASAHVESNIRTAGVSTIPGFSGTSNNVSTDLQQALKSIFSKPEFEG